MKAFAPLFGGRCGLLFMVVFALFAGIIGNGRAEGVDSTATLIAAEAQDSGGADWIGQLAVIFGLILLNGFFVASEFAIVRMRSAFLDTMERPERRSVQLSRRILDNVNAYLSATQLGITIASLALGWLSEIFIAAFFWFPGVSEVWLHAGALVLAFALVVFLHVVLGELIPKVLASRHPLNTMLLMSRPLHGFYIVFRLPIFILNGTAHSLLRVLFRIDPDNNGELAHSAEELRLLVEEGKGVSDVTETEREIVSNALELSDLAVRDVMTPRKDIVCMDVSKSFEENWELARATKHTRFPLIDGHLDHTVGIVHIKDMIDLLESSEKDLRAIANAYDAVPELMPVDRVLGKFLKANTHMTIAVDEYGGAVGIVCLEDLLEEVVGDIRDEFDEDHEEQEFYPINDGEFKVRGSLGLYELEDYCDLELDTPDVSTIGGYVTQCFGRLPTVGEEIDIEGYRVTVTKTDGLRIEELHFKRKPAPETSPPPEGTDSAAAASAAPALETQETSHAEKAVRRP